MANTKLLKVMDYLINEQEDKARELLHQIFIEKARAIHEEMMSHDDMDEDMMGGDQGEHLTKQIKADMNEIDSEESYGPGTMEGADEELEVDDAEEDLSDELEDMDDDMSDVEDADDMDMGSDEVEDTEMTQVDMEEPEMGAEDDGDKIHDLEQAIAQLTAEFNALKDEVEGADHDEENHDEEDHADEDKMAEAWEGETNDLDEEYDDLDENVDLETVHAAKGGEVGAGKFAPAETNTHSPVPSTLSDTMGARPVKTGQGTKATGYDRQKAPDSKSMNLSNRRKDADQGKHPVSKEGDSGALLNKGTSAGYGAVNTRSPISGRK